MSEPTPQDIARDYLARERRMPFPDRGEDPLWRWERWIDEDPERAWVVFKEVAHGAPDDVEILEQLSFRIPQLLSRHWDDFHERVRGLVAKSDLLKVIVDPDDLSDASYAPVEQDLGELAVAWLRNHEHSSARHEVDEILRSDAEVGLRIAVEVVERGPLYGVDEWDAGGPLRDLVFSQGPRVIDAIEELARGNEHLRRVIWGLRRLGPDEDDPTLHEVWPRFLAAAGETTFYNCPKPVGRHSQLGPGLEELVEHWFVAQANFWAYCDLDELISDEPARGFEAIKAIVRATTSMEALASVGAGPLEDLIRAHPQDFVEEVEELAASDEGFRHALAGSWITLEDVPMDLAMRYRKASGDALQILDLPRDANLEGDDGV